MTQEEIKAKRKDIMWDLINVLGKHGLSVEDLEEEKNQCKVRELTNGLTVIAAGIELSLTRKHNGY